MKLKINKSIMEVEYCQRQAVRAKKAKKDQDTKNLEFSMADTVEHFLSTLMSAFHIEKEPLKIIVERDGGSIELVVDNPSITLAEWALRGNVLKERDDVKLLEIDPTEEDEVGRAGEAIHKENKKAGRVYRILAEVICCSKAGCQISFELDNKLSHATVSLAYNYESKEQKRFGYFYIRNIKNANLSFSIRFMTTEPFSAIKNDKRFKESKRDLYLIDQLKNFSLKAPKSERMVEETRNAKIYCIKHFKQKFPERYDNARTQLQDIGADFYDIPTDDPKNVNNDMHITFTDCQNISANITQDNQQFTKIEINSLISRITPDQEEFLKLHGQEQSFTTLHGLSQDLENGLPTIENWMRSVCMIVTPGGIGTGFLTNVPNIGICYMTAGHNFTPLFEDANGQFVPLTKSQIFEYFDKSTVFFGNLKGVISDSAPLLRLGKRGPMNFQKFLCDLHFNGSIGFKYRTIKFKKTGNTKMLKKYMDSWDISYNNAPEYQDYCCFSLDKFPLGNPEQVLNQYGLSCLPCGKDDYLDYKQDGVVIIVGHPAIEVTSSNSPCYPLRLSFGVEKVPDPSYLPNTFLSFDYDSLPGSSGSPVIGRGHESTQGGGEQTYSVKGIHVYGDQHVKKDDATGKYVINKNNMSKDDIKNCAQKIKITGWI